MTSYPPKTFISDSPSFRFDVFLSHNANDKPRVRQLAERLKAAGLRVWLDEWIIQAGDIIALKVDEGLEQSRVLLLCISQAALASDWVALERSTVIHRDPANVERRFIPLLLEDCKLPDTLRRYKNVDFREESETAFAEVLAACQHETRSLHPPSFHPLSRIPQAPIAYVAHPYVLLQTKSVIGRRLELDELTDWITKNELVPADIRIFSVVALGGMGKSALTWKWFADIASNQLPDFAGRMWWSFYESDAHWENFIIRALAYTAGAPETEVRQLPSPDREDRLLRLLDEQPFLLVLDGLERILLAYARMDAAHVSDDDDDLDRPTTDVIAGANDPTDSVRESYFVKHRPRQCADLRAAAFLRKLTRVRASRVLISTRLYPAELETQTLRPLPGCYRRDLRGLTDDDALALWRGFIGGAKSGSDEQLLPLFRTFGNYPLLLRALAGEVAQYRPAPGNFDRWRRDHSDFNPGAQLDLRNAKTHVLEFALRGLDEAQRRTLHTLAAFRMPAMWDTLCALLIGSGKPCIDDNALDAVLTALEDRSLIGWDNKANRYDLHPIVRSVVWATLEAITKRDIHVELLTYLEALPMPRIEYRETLDDLTPVIELFHILIELAEYKKAHTIWLEYIVRGFRRHGANRLNVQATERFFPNEMEPAPGLESKEIQTGLLHKLANAYRFVGEPLRAIPVFKRELEIHRDQTDARGYGLSRGNLSRVYCLTGFLRLAETSALAALLTHRDNEGLHLRWVGICYAACGDWRRSFVSLERALRVWTLKSDTEGIGSTKTHRMQRQLWMMQPVGALQLAKKLLRWAVPPRQEGQIIRVLRLSGAAAVGAGNLPLAEERLRPAITRARAANLVEEELPALTALAELNRQRKKYEDARELLEEVWAPAERGPYPLWHADARNVLAQIERDLNNTSAAINAATTAYRLAWCDGPPYAYHYGLTHARRHLHELGASEPQLAPFDERKFPPMPYVELNPEDEYWIDPEKMRGF